MTLRLIEISLPEDKLQEVEDTFISSCGNRSYQ